MKSFERASSRARTRDYDLICIASRRGITCNWRESVGLVNGERRLSCRLGVSDLIFHSYIIHSHRLQKDGGAAGSLDHLTSDSPNNATAVPLRITSVEPVVLRRILLMSVGLHGYIRLVPVWHEGRGVAIRLTALSRIHGRQARRSREDVSYERE